MHVSIPRYVSHVVTFYLRRSRSESVRADTLESALQVRARPVSAYVHVDLALVLVHALLARRVQDVSGRTLAPVRSVGVYALASVARVRHEITFVQILALVAAADALGTQFAKRVCNRPGVTTIESYGVHNNCC